MEGKLKTLYDAFDELLSNPKVWAYYSEMPSYNIEAVFKDPKEFILKYLQMGAKNTLELASIINKLEDERIEHTISIFLLGLLFFERNKKIKLEINAFIKQKKEILKVKRPQIKHNFVYWWFLMCFIHDIGYAYNNRNKKNIKIFNLLDKGEIERIQDLNPEMKLLYGVTGDLSLDYLSLNCYYFINFY